MLQLLVIFFIAPKSSSSVNKLKNLFEEMAENNKPEMITRGASKAKDNIKLSEESDSKDLKESPERYLNFSNTNEKDTESYEKLLKENEKYQKRLKENAENYQKLLKENEEGKESYRELLKVNEEDKVKYQKLLKENEEITASYQRLLKENQELKQIYREARDEDNPQRIRGSLNEGKSFQELLREKERDQLKLQEKDQEYKNLKIDVEKNKRRDSGEIKTLNDKICNLENVIKTKDREIERLRIEVGKNRNVPSPTVSDDESSSAKRRKPTECRWNILTSVD